MTNLVGLEVKEFDNRCNEEIGLRIQNKRIERNMTGAELGTYLSVNANQVYINEKGLNTIRQHAKDFIAKREAPAYIANDGKQTPMRGHPVFIAQHATATCCRECIRKWHKMQPGKKLSQVQRDYLVDVIMTWIQKEIERQEHKI